MYPCQLSKCQVVSVTEPLTTFAAVYVVAQLCHVVLNSTLDLHSIEVNMNPILWGDYTKYLWKYISSVVSAYLGNTSTFAVLFIFFTKRSHRILKYFQGRIMNKLIFTYTLFDPLVSDSRIHTSYMYLMKFFWQKLNIKYYVCTLIFLPYRICVAFRVLL